MNKIRITTKKRYLLADSESYFRIQREGQEKEKYVPARKLMSGDRIFLKEVRDWEPVLETSVIEHEEEGNRQKLEDGTLFCVKCLREVPAPHAILFKGEFWHSSCFTAETEAATLSLKSNPRVNVSLQANEVKFILDVIEACVDISKEGNHNELQAHLKGAQTIYGHLAVRLAEVTRECATCTGCGKVRLREQMLQNKKLKDAYLFLVNQFTDEQEMKRVKKATIFLFCSQECSTSFFKKESRSVLSLNKEKVQQLIAAAAAPTAAPTAPTATTAAAAEVNIETRAQTEAEAEAEPEIVEEPEGPECFECHELHAIFHCEDCGAWLGRGTCAWVHEKRHEEEEEAEMSKIDPKVPEEMEKTSKAALLQKTSHKELAELATANAIAEAKTRLSEKGTGDLLDLFVRFEGQDEDFYVMESGVRLKRDSWLSLIEDVLEDRDIQEEAREEAEATTELEDFEGKAQNE